MSQIKPDKVIGRLEKRMSFRRLFRLHPPLVAPCDQQHTKSIWLVSSSSSRRRRLSCIFVSPCSQIAHRRSSSRNIQLLPQMTSVSWGHKQKTCCCSPTLEPADRFHERGGFFETQGGAFAHRFLMLFLIHRPNFALNTFCLPETKSKSKKVLPYPGAWTASVV